MEVNNKTLHIQISSVVVEKWQNIINLLAEIAHVPAGLIMRIVNDSIEVFVASNNESNPYHPGESEYLWNSGLYCERVIKTRKKLLVKNALESDEWKNNPDVKLHMISYLGYPLLYPDGTPFGTICILDSKENTYSKTYENLMINFRDIIQAHLELVYMNYILGEENKNLSDYISEIKTLRGIIPICSFCKNIRNDEGYWESVEAYLSHHSHAEFSHGICPDCKKKYYGDE
jgi:transcriptional regulator with GAF, ATPase, and Fis domain